jgi:glucose-1-phosphatase
MYVLIFDLGGVLVSDATIYHKDNLCDFSSVLDLAKVNQNDAKKLWIKYWHDMKLGYKDINDFWNEFNFLIQSEKNLNEIIQKYEDCIIIDNEMLKFILNLKRNYKLYALANVSRSGINLKIKKFSLNKIFEKIYCSANLNMAKPNLNIFEYVINDLNINPKNIIFIDNQIENVNAALSLGINSIHYKNLNQLKNDLLKFKIL